MLTAKHGYVVVLDTCIPLHTHLGNTTRKCLAEPVTEAIVAGIQHCYAGAALSEISAPSAIVTHQLRHVEPARMILGTNVLKDPKVSTSRIEISC